MPEDDPNVFRHYVKWLYSKEPPFAEERSSPKDPEYFTVILKLCIFAEVRDIPPLYNAVIDRLLSICKTSNILPTCCSSLVYENSPQNSPLRRLFADMAVNLVPDKAWFGSSKEGQYPKDFLLDTTKSYCQKLSELKARGGWAALEAKEYHL